MLALILVPRIIMGGRPHRRFLHRLLPLAHQGPIKAAFLDQDEVSYYFYPIFVMLAFILVPIIAMGGWEAASTVSISGLLGRFLLRTLSTITKLIYRFLGPNQRRTVRLYLQNRFQPSPNLSQTLSLTYPSLAA